MDAVRLQRLAVQRPLALRTIIVTCKRNGKSVGTNRQERWVLINEWWGPMEDIELKAMSAKSTLESKNEEELKKLQSELIPTFVVTSRHIDAEALRVLLNIRHCHVKRVRVRYASRTVVPRSFFLL